MIVGKTRVSGVARVDGALDRAVWGGVDGLHGEVTLVGGVVERAHRVVLEIHT